MSTKKTTLQNAVARAKRALKKFSENEIDLVQLGRVLDAASRASNRDCGPEDQRAKLDAEISELRRGIPAAEQKARAARQYARDVEIARLDREEREERRGGVRYEPGLGYVQGQRVVG